MEIEIWSDVVCPWCYVGKRNFETALAQFEHREDVTVRWRSFELDRSAPTERTGSYTTHLARKYGMSEAQAQASIDTMTQTGARAGVVLDFDRARPGNTFDAHRLLHLAADHGLQDAMKERLFRGTFTDGEPIGDRRALARLAEDVGLPPAEVTATLEGDAYATDVRADEDLAIEFGISAVPFFVIDRKFGIPGAQPPDVIVQVLDRAWNKLQPAAATAGGGEAPGCEGDACAL